MYASAHRSAARGEHAMWGKTAADMFPDPAVAALARAACAGDQGAVGKAVTGGTDPDATGGEGWGPEGTLIVTPLLWAVACGSVPGIEALLQAGADPNLAVNANQSAVTVAADNADPEILKVLLDNGGDPNASTERRTALEIAMDAGSIFQNMNGLPADKAWANWDALLAAGADPDRVAPMGRPLMEVASLGRHWVAVEWLLNHGWTGDFAELGRLLERDEEFGHMFPATAEALQRVKVMLAARGVTFPAGQ
jgi:hypothetical protein